jgi:ADP-ribose pyrophosphatase YjhB (NUDIX family)
VAGYVTPKSAIGAVVYDDQQRIHLVQRADSGVWLYPTGWADVGYSPAEVAVKEVREETGIECVPEGVVAVLDGMRMGMTRIPLYSTVFLCRATGGDLKAHPLETRDVGWFAEDELPEWTIGVQQWGSHAFAAIRGEALPVLFDPPRANPWHP